eukprot:364869-Chlamydomonas_euryale.AAC.9
MHPRDSKNSGEGPLRTWYKSEASVVVPHHWVLDPGARIPHPNDTSGLKPSWPRAFHTSRPSDHRKMRTFWPAAVKGLLENVTVSFTVWVAVAPTMPQQWLAGAPDGIADTLCEMTGAADGSV